MIEVIVKYGQTLFDVAMEQYGCEEGVITIANDNALAIDDDLLPGQILLIQPQIPELSINNITIANYFNTNKIGVNSGVIEVPTPEPTLGFFDDDFYAIEFFD